MKLQLIEVPNDEIQAQKHKNALEHFKSLGVDAVTMIKIDSQTSDQLKQLKMKIIEIDD